MTDIDISPQGLGRLRGKACLVTGAAAGIGRATAELFAREGALLALFDRDAAALETLADRLTAEGAEVVGVAGDVSQDADVRRAVDAAVGRFGRLDVLVANAGIIPLSDALETSPEEWDAVMAIDGRGMFLSCKHAIAAMLEGGGGSIVCLSSISGLAGQKRQAAYGPAKFVASGITKHLAIEWADKGIRVNAVAPGTVWTDFHRDPDRPAKVAATIPMGRAGRPEEIAGAVSWLLSEDASYATGTTIRITGGL